MKNSIQRVKTHIAQVFILNRDRIKVHAEKADVLYFCHKKFKIKFKLKQQGDFVANNMKQVQTTGLIDAKKVKI